MSDLDVAVENAVDTELQQGLSHRPLSIPSKYFYDDRGSALFDAICECPEYYLTRSEKALLDQHSGAIAAITRANELVELGAGTARKTGHLIRSLLDRGNGLHYTPLDISRFALDEAEFSLSQDFPELSVTGVLCDYTEGLEALDPDPGCLAVFLGSTVGNFSHASGVALLRRLRDRLAPGDWFLLGVDLVKPIEILEAAYNDEAGVTSEFNKNILRAVNREVGGDFDPDEFEHQAVYNRRENQIEMYVVAESDTRVNLEALDLRLEIEAGERIRTEISRKFTRDSTVELLADSGFDLHQWFLSNDGYFALALAVAKGD